MIDPGTAGPRVGFIQLVQVRCVADGSQHGVRAGDKKDSCQQSVTWTYIHTVSVARRHSCHS